MVAAILSGVLGALITAVLATYVETRRRIAEVVQDGRVQRREIYAAALADLTNFEQLLVGAARAGHLSDETLAEISKLQADQVGNHARVHLVGPKEVRYWVDLLARQLSNIRLVLMQERGALVTHLAEAGHEKEFADRELKKISDETRTECIRAMRIDLRSDLDRLL